MCLRKQIRPSFPRLSERSCLIGSSALWDQQRTKWQLSISPSAGRCIDLRSLTCFWNIMFLWSYQHFLCFSKCFLIQMIQNRYGRNNSSTSELENWFHNVFVCFVLDNNWIDFWTTTLLFMSMLLQKDCDRLTWLTDDPQRLYTINHRDNGVNHTQF